MAIQLQCSKCRKPLRVPDHAAGKKAKCPACGAMMTVPRTAAKPTKRSEGPYPPISRAHAVGDGGYEVAPDDGSPESAPKPWLHASRPINADLVPTASAREASAERMGRKSRPFPLAFKSLLSVSALVVCLVACIAVIVFSILRGAEKSQQKFLNALQGEDDSARLLAAVELAQLGPKAVEPLTAALKDERPQVRFLAAKALGWIGPDAEAAVPTLEETLQDRAEFHPGKVFARKRHWRVDGPKESALRDSDVSSLWTAEVMTTTTTTTVQTHSVVRNMFGTVEGRETTTTNTTYVASVSRAAKLALKRIHVPADQKRIAAEMNWATRSH